MTTAKNLYLFDLDGTLADDRHRQHYAKASNWEKYFAQENMMADLPYGQCVELISGAKESGSEIGFLTARDERSREVTVRWLELHGFPTENLYMKPLNCPNDSSNFKALWIEVVMKSGKWDKVVHHENNLPAANVIRELCGESSVVLCEWQLETFVHLDIPIY